MTKMRGDETIDFKKEEKFIIKDSNERVEFPSGMVRDIGREKVRYNRCLEGPMFKRWAEHLHKGAVKYPDVSVGVANWTLASGKEELQRFKESALSHMIDWLMGAVDEDHAAGVFFNINGAEFVKARINPLTEEEKDGSKQINEEERIAGKVGC